MNVSPVISNRCAMAHWCIVNELQVCHRNLGNGHILLGPLGILSPSQPCHQSKKTNGVF